MAVHVLLSVDLNQVSTSARQRFYEELKKRQWVKLKLTTAWTAQFKPTTSKADALAVTKEDVAQAASLAGVRDYEAVASLSDEEAKEWRSKPTSGLLG